MSWIEPILSTIPDIDFTFDIINAKSSKSRKIVIDILQDNSCVSIEEVLEYHDIFDRVILINCETPNNITQILPKIDLSKVYLLNTGRIKQPLKNMIVKNHENFFGVVQSLYCQDGYKDLEKLTPYTDKPLVFDVLLGNEKPHREYVYQEITNHCKDKAYLRYFRKIKSLKQVLGDGDFEWPPEAHVAPGTNIETWGTQEIAVYNGRETAISCVVPVDIYNQCAYSIVTESRVSNDYVFLTEKTAKCLVAKRLFVMFAGAYYLEHLRSLGFKTFGDIIDESYDEILDHRDRWKMAFNQVKALLSMPQQDVLCRVRDVTEHNYQVFTQIDWVKNFHDNIINSVK